MTPNIDSKQMAIGICILYISELNQQQQQFVAQKMQFCNKHPFNCGYLLCLITFSSEIDHIQY